MEIVGNEQERRCALPGKGAQSINECDNGQSPRIPDDQRTGIRPQGVGEGVRDPLTVCGAHPKEMR